MRTKWFCMQLMTAYKAKISCNQLLLILVHMCNSPVIDSIAMSLYDIITLLTCN